MLRSRLFLFLGLILVGAASQAALGVHAFVGWFQDDAGYLQAAQRLVYHGHCPVCAQPIAASVYGIGWPLLLAPFLGLFHDRLDLYPLITVAVTLLFVLLVTELVRREFGIRLAGLVGLILLFSQGLLEYGATLMSEPYYAALIAAILLLQRPARRLQEQPEEPARRAALSTQGVLAALCLATRPEGAAAFLALLVSWIIGRDRRAILVGGGSFFLVCLALSGFFLEANAHRLQQSQQFFGQNVALTDFVFSWMMNQSLLLGQSLLVGPAWLARGLAAWLWLAFLLCSVRRPEFRAWPGFWLVLATASALVLWPYLSPRYWMATWPVWILAALACLPAKARSPVLLAVLGLQLGLLWAHPPRAARPHLQATEELYRQVQLSRPDEVVCTVCPLRTHLLSHRRTLLFPSSPSLGAVARFMAREGSSVLVWEHHFALLTNIGGTTQVTLPPQLGLWLERCTMYQTLFQNSAGLVVRLQRSSDQIEAGFAAWERALQAKTPQEELAVLQEGLRVVPDLPELRALTLLALLKQQPFLEAQAAGPVRSYFEQYPHDVDLALIVCLGLRQLGASATADWVAERCWEDAVARHDEVAQTRLRGLKTPPSP